MKEPSFIFVSCVYGTLITIIYHPLTLEAQGSLTPPGPPAPIMKTLAQIEPRIPISSVPYTISAPGAYYLTANLTGITGTSGITIAADNVDLDLMGFTLAGVTNSGDGINVPATHVNIAIYNGNLQGWGGYGFNGTNASNSQLERLRVFNNISGGLAIGSVSIVADCQASSNHWNGITAGDGCIVKDCIASANGGFQIPTGSGGSGIVGGNNVVASGCVLTLNFCWGMILSNDCTIRSCSVVSNNVIDIGFGGILTGSGCVIIDCTANRNCPATSFGGKGGITTGNSCIIKECNANYNDCGILTGDGCNIINCIARSNFSGAGEGIYVGNSCVVRDCVVENNPYQGILSGSYCLILENNTSGNGHSFATTYPDIQWDGSHNTVIRNLMETNWTSGFNSSPSNAIGTFETSLSLNTNKDPHANFSP